MEPGEKELRKAFEDTSTKNIKTMFEHGNETRKIVRKLETIIKQLQAQILEQNKRFEQINKQLAGIQAKVYSGGT